ncbi:unnamed protein product (macronuclear) [Paramecium tetraurelia]|uniref:Uncharacterized protein n=1 Tax=Paramecium tetraurelia TaxID=5888 RepID=A0DMP2_PARTE|nr:uncharacterized protein GSPATT00018513001 [Paramecium tetraurelia]CAK84309.1 unnamed protein product [Paramecium tetraurelia]|eukprot:XP_001451706.1 hypothetical protein (macronuclear) [Paramecium tetraurelia strain d4-2]
MCFLTRLLERRQNFQNQRNIITEESIIQSMHFYQTTCRQPTHIYINNFQLYSKQMKDSIKRNQYLRKYNSFPHLRSTSKSMQSN